MSGDSKKADGAFPAPISLATGFRFHPTDEEIVCYYLKRKVLGKPMRDVIEEVDIYKHEPWDLADHSKLKTRDQDWFFFSRVNKIKSCGGLQVNRATKEGYWKKTGDSKAIIRGGEDEDQSVIGMRKSLVYYSGRGPGGLRTKWLMHEYHLVKNKDESHLQLDAYVLCRVSKMEKAGGSSGIRYAPLLEEDWNDEDDSGRTVIPSVPVVETNRINESQQDKNSRSKKLINPNKLPRESEIDEDSYPQQKHHDNNEEDGNVDVPLKRNSNRKVNSIGNFNSSSQPIQDPSFSTETEPVATMVSPSSSTKMISNLQNENKQEPVATMVSLSSFTKMISNLQNENEQEPVTTMVSPSSFTKMISNLQNENEQEPVTTMVSPNSSTKMINDLVKKKQEIILDTETLKLEMKEAEMMINWLEEKVDAFLEENEKLRNNIKNKKQ